MFNIIICLTIIILIIFIINYKEHFFECGELEFIYVENGKKHLLNYEDLLNKEKNFDLLVIAGVHGNEYGPTYGLEKFIKDNYKNIRSSILFIPRVNQQGLKEKVRFMNCFGEKYDINRNFKKNGNKFQQKIMKLVEKSNFILDFHEGYDFHIKNRSSIGSTIMTSNKKNLDELVKYLIFKINKTILESNKKFIHYINPNFRIKNSLRDFCINNKKDYLLVEITGQNNKQKLNVRISQTIILLNNFFIYKGLFYN